VVSEAGSGLVARAAHCNKQRQPPAVSLSPSPPVWRNTRTETRKSERRPVHPGAQKQTVAQEPLERVTTQRHASPVHSRDFFVERQQAIAGAQICFRSRSVRGTVQEGGEAAHALRSSVFCTMYKTHVRKRTVYRCLPLCRSWGSLSDALFLHWEWFAEIKHLRQYYNFMRKFLNSPFLVFLHFFSFCFSYRTPHSRSLNLHLALQNRRCHSYPGHRKTRRPAKQTMSNFFKHKFVVSTLTASSLRTLSLLSSLMAAGFSTVLMVCRSASFSISFRRGCIQFIKYWRRFLRHLLEG
jgi:hypothetical protein